MATVLSLENVEKTYGKKQKAMFKAEKNIYHVKTDGFHGELFLPTEDKYPGNRKYGNIT